MTEVESLIAQRMPEDIRSVVSADAISNLKFGECLPANLAEEVFSARFNDFEAIATIRRERLRVAVLGSEH